MFLLVYRKATDFCMLILYPGSLLNSLIKSNNFWWSLQGCLHTRSCHQQAKNFTSSFPIRILFICFSYLISLAKNLGTVWNSNGEREHPYLAPNLREKAFKILLFNKLNALTFSGIA